MIRILGLGMCLALACAAFAGGGPAGVVVLYNGDDLVSRTLASHYQRVRGIPERNMVPIVFPASYSRETCWALIEQLRAMLKGRGLEQQLHAFALVGATPLNSGYDWQQCSLHSALYLAPCFTPEKQPEANARNTAYRAVPFRPAAVLDGHTPVNGKVYWPVSSVAPSQRGALSLQAALATIDAAKAADGARPDGVIYWPLNTNVRSTTRQGQIAQVQPVWEELGIRSILCDGAWISQRCDIVGGVVGTASTNPTQGNRYLPGAWVDHLTSYGGVLQGGGGQMPCTDWLIAGAAGSAGTMAEPLAVAAKFPHAHIHTYFRQGASLSEAFWSSLQMPREIICVGDPLMQPYARFPRVAFGDPPVGPVQGVISLRVMVEGDVLTDPNLDLLVDGRRVRFGDQSEPVGASRVQNRFTLDTATLTDGWHELRVVAYTADAVRTQGEAVLPLIVTNHGRTVVLRGPARLTCDGDNEFTATTTGQPAATVIELRTGGRVLATLTPGMPAKVAGRALPLVGPCTLFAVAQTPNGEVCSAPLMLPVEWTALPAQQPPALGTGQARLRVFGDTRADAFRWEHPEVEGPHVASDGLMTLSDKTNNPAMLWWEKLDRTTQPGIEVACWMAVPEEGIYEFNLGNDASELKLWEIDGQAFPLRDGELIGPMKLAVGWHLLRARLIPRAQVFTFNPQVRGGPFAKFTPLPVNWCATVAPDNAAAPPRITALLADGKAPEPGDAIRTAGKTLELKLTADSAEPLNCAWVTVGGPLIGMPGRWESVAPVTYTTQGLTTRATFVAAGRYLLRATVTGAGTSAVALVPVEVLPVANGVVVSTLPGHQAIQGSPLVVHARAVDQFGKRLPEQPDFTWSTDAAEQGVYTRLSRETVSFSAAPGVTECRLIAAAGAQRGALSVKFAPK